MGSIGKNLINTIIGKPETHPDDISPRLNPHNPNKDAKGAAADAQNQAKLAADTLADKTKKDQAEADAIIGREDARRRHRALRGGSFRDTLLTGPYGLSDTSGGQRKTLLGG